MRNSGSSFRRKRKVFSEMNVVPYVDVMLVLLVIFMSTVQVETNGAIDLPRAGLSNAKPQDYIEVSVFSDGRFQVKRVGVSEKPDDKQSSDIRTKEDLVRQVQFIAGVGNPHKIPVVISGDKSTPYGQVIETMTELQKNNLGRVALMVKRE